ncbi:POK6 protein, partial [Scopus umbretta]|nr:POK6 protein [Scopus umbretta]
REIAQQSPATQEILALALTGFAGKTLHEPSAPIFRHMTQLTVDQLTKVRSTPQIGPTVFSNASSATSTVVVVWNQKGQWLKIAHEDPAAFVQYLEAEAVAMACDLHKAKHLNIVTDSMFVAKLCNHMGHAGVAQSEIAVMIEGVLQRRQGTVTVIHVNSHTSIRGFYQEGNNMADKAARKLWTLSKAKNLHENLHVGVKALASTCHISMTDAKQITASCLYCQKSPLWTAGVNLRGTKGSDLWQTDFTLCPLLKPRPWLAVTVDTFSGCIVATQCKSPTSKATINHWITAVAWLGVPAKIKTDNGPNFIAKSMAQWAEKWGIMLVRGIPYNSTGQAIVERANQTLKTKLEVLAQLEGFHLAIPSSEQARLLSSALLSLNQFHRGDENKTPMQKHWTTRALEEGPLVMVKTELGSWEKGWQLMLVGRGYGAVKNGDSIRWCPLKCIKPDLT